MKNTLTKYLPLAPVLAGYFLLFLVGENLEGKWQLIAMLAFYCALGQAFNLFMGMTGYVDFGYVAFLGVGTYGMAIAISRLFDKGLGLWLLVIGLLMSIGMATLLSLAVGAVALRLRGAYFAIATIGVNEGFRYLIEGARLWGGSEGIIFTGQLNTAFGRDFANVLATYWADVALFVIAALAAILTLVFLRSKIGYA
ncbi:MAG: hypothetical protein WBG20_03150, partial [Candidatus Deferrimicrobiaceae bacterium]